MKNYFNHNIVGHTDHFIHTISKSYHQNTISKHFGVWSIKSSEEKENILKYHKYTFQQLSILHLVNNL